MNTKIPERPFSANIDTLHRRVRWISRKALDVHRASARALDSLMTNRIDAEEEVTYELADLLTGMMSELDNSSSNPELDGLVDGPGGPIGALNGELADLYSAAAARITVSGSSGTNLAVIGVVLPSLLKSGRKTVLVDRDCHVSVIGGLVVSGLAVRWVRRAYLPQHDVQAPIDVADIERMLDAHDDIGAVVLTSPTYDGFDAPLEALARLCRARGVLLLVDAAWGPGHGALCDAGFPQSAIVRGAHIASTSLHKKGFAPSQIAVALFADPEHAAIFDVAGSLGFQTTSPNYVLLGSAEHLVNNLTDGVLAEAWTAAVRTAENLAQRIAREVPGCRVIGRADVGAASSDPTHLLVHVAAAGIIGQQLFAAMNDRGFDPEKATKDTVLFLIGPQEAQDPDGFMAALRSAVFECRNRPAAGRALAASLEVPRFDETADRSIRDAVIGPTESVPLDRAVGRIAAQIVAVYPPGVALFVPGEHVRAEHLAYIRAVKAAGGNIRGLSRLEGNPIRVVAE